MYGSLSNRRFAAAIVTALLAGGAIVTEAASDRSQLATPTPLQARLSGTWQIKFPDAEAQTRDRQAVMQMRQSNVTATGAPRIGPPPEAGAFQVLDSVANDAQSAAARDDAHYFNFTGRTLLSPATMLSITANGSMATVVRDLESMMFDTTAGGQPRSWAGVPVTVKSAFTNDGLTQDIEGDHHLKVSQSYEPSADGQILTVTVKLLSPSLLPELKLLMRTYVRVSDNSVAPTETVAAGGAPGGVPREFAVPMIEARYASTLPIRTPPPGSILTGNGFEGYHFGMTSAEARQVPGCRAYKEPTNLAVYQRAGVQPPLTCAEYAFRGQKMSLTLSFGAGNALDDIRLAWRGGSATDALKMADAVLSYLSGAVGHVMTLSGQPLTAQDVSAALAQQLKADPDSSNFSVPIAPPRVFQDEYVAAGANAGRIGGTRRVEYGVFIQWISISAIVDRTPFSN
jgi:hypothetical protein